MLNGRYANYTTDTTNIAQGASVAMRVTNGFPYTLDHFGMWVDWNNNGNFLDDPAVTVTGITGGGLYSAAITCQVGVSEGSKRMRFRIHYDGEATSPCGTAIWEEVEDYTIIVTGSVWTLSLIHI